MTATIILLALVALAFATRQLLRANNEEQCDDTLVPPCGPMPAITDIPRTEKAPGFHADLIFGERRDTLPSPMLEELTGEPAPVLKLELPPLDDLPDVTDDAVESAARSLSERPKGDV